MESETDFESDLTDENLEKNPKILLKVDSLKRHICPYEGCQSAFNRPWKLERHINVHTKNRPFKCDFPGCAKDYMNNSHLNRHKSLSHAKNKAAAVYIHCPYPDCMKTFSNKWSLKRHCNIHKLGDSYKCQICSSTFKKHGQLKDHLSIHSGLKPFTCTTCNDTFESRKMLKRHERKHKMYQCDEVNCQEKFNKFNALRAHIKMAHPKCLKCDFCGNLYVNKWTLTEHILSHLPKEKREVLTCPYDDCERYYLHQRNLDHHIKSYHQNINYQCEFCNQTLVNKTNLRKHQKLHLEPKKSRVSNLKILRKSRKDKGLPQKSKAAMLSGIVLPKHIDKKLAQNNITPEVEEHIESIKKIISTANINVDTAPHDIS